MNSPLTEMVTLPEDYFAKSAFCAYARPKVAFFRETLQNAVDAGATIVSFTLGETTITVDDNGDGMSKEILLPAMLTLSGSYKRPGSIGGFGAAKELILFSQREFSIHTRDMLVEGQGLRYSINPAEPRTGTRITVTPGERFGYDQASYLALAREYLETCDTEATILLNGEPTARLRIARTAKVLEWGRVCVKQLRGTDTDTAVVRIRGVSMFHAWVGSTKKQVAVEIDKPSTEILSSNRDGFSCGFSNEFSALMVELAINRESFGQKRGFTGVIKGTTDYYRLLKDSPEKLAALLSIIGEVRGAECALEVGVRLSSLVADGRADGVNAIVESVLEFIERDSVEHSRDVAAALAPAVEPLDCDFVIAYGEYTEATLPRLYHPRRLGRRLRMLSVYWRETIKALLPVLASDVTGFRIGWSFEEDKATHVREPGGSMHTFLINPSIAEWKKAPRAYFNDIVSLAVHEITHACGYSFHDERYATALTSNMAKALTALPRVKRQIRAKVKAA